MTVRRSVVAALVVIAGSVSLCGLAQTSPAGAAQPGAAHLADLAVPGPAEAVSIALPASPYSAYRAFIRVLEAAGARYGVEGPASDPTAPPIDFARRFDRVAPLGGRRLGDALDVIVKAAPQYRWSEVAGAIVVRASADGEGILDRRVDRFAISNATPRAALEALVAAVDPARAPGLGVVERSGPDRDVSGAPLVRRSVTVSLRDTTVSTILTTIAREHGALSWTINYDRPPAALDTSTILFTALGGMVRAASPSSLRTDQLDPDGRWWLAITTLTDMLLSYSERAGVSVNIEEIASNISRTTISSLTSGTPPLELSETPAIAIARIVALDSRYEWSERGGRFLVQPRPGVPGRLAVLDRAIPGLSATNESAGPVIERLLNSVGSVRESGGSSIGRGPSARTDAMATHVDIHLDGPATVRDGLNAIADAAGWMWSARLASPSDLSMVSLQWRGRGERVGTTRRGSPVPPGGNANSWSSIFLVAVDAGSPHAPPPPLRPPPGAVPPPAPTPATRPVRVNLPVTPDSLRHVLVDANHENVPLGIEIVAVGTPAPAGFPPRYSDLTGLTMAETFAKLQELTPDYVFSVDRGVYHVRPRDAQRDSTPWLNQVVPRFQQRFESMRDALVAVAGLGQPHGEPALAPSPLPEEREALLKKTVVVSLKDVTVRSILDELSRQHGAMAWVVEQRVATSGPLVRLTFSSNAGWSITATVR